MSKKQRHPALRAGANMLIVFGLLLCVFGLGGTAGGVIMEILPTPFPDQVGSAARLVPVTANIHPQVRPKHYPTPQILEAQGESRLLLVGEESLPDAVEAPTAEVSPTPAPPVIPDRIVIPRIGIDAPVVSAGEGWVQVDDQVYHQWQAPEFYAAGWHPDSATLGLPGNTVLSGHHNIFDKVFERLSELEKGDVIALYSGDQFFGYYVSQVVKVEERDASLEQRIENSRWIRPTSDERLTLISCWPPENNTYRLIVIAYPE